MLKLQYLGTTKSVWLIGPTMKLGSANNNDLIVSGEGVAPLHVLIKINGDSIIIEPTENNKTYINETLLDGKKSLNLSDIIRIGTKEFVVIDPKMKTGSVATTPADAPVSAEATVFRAAVSPSAPNAQQASGWMLQGMHKNLRNKRYPIEGTMILGRSQDCELHFSYDRLSRKHAEFKIIDGVLILRDLDSSNGCFHNGEKVKNARLHPGDTVSFDKLEFTVIGPNNSPAESENALNQTVMRSAITPEMIKQAGKSNKSAPSAVTGSNANSKPMKTKTSIGNALMITAAVVIVVLGVVMFFI